MKGRWFPLLAIAGVRLALPMPPAAADSPAAKETPAPMVGKPAPAFARMDIDGKKRDLSAFRGRRVALFFFCGCSWCADVAREWATLQRNGALAETRKAKPVTMPVTLVVYSGLDAPAARDLSIGYGLDRKQSVILSDPKMETTEAYRADPCPRVFVLDGGGVLRYTNNNRDDAPRKAPAFVIVSRALEALRAAGERKTTAASTGGR